MSCAGLVRDIFVFAELPFMLVVFFEIPSPRIIIIPERHRKTQRSNICLVYFKSSVVPVFFQSTKISYLSSFCFDYRSKAHFGFTMKCIYLNADFSY